VVYVAEQEEPVRRKVALKVIKAGMDTRAVVARFEAERQALALMDHPNIAKVLEAGATETGRPYFVMELVRGLRITDYCDRNHLPTRERLDLFIQVCRAVQHAHQKGIIHRDLKPSNILVTVNDGVAVPKVIDFGIAKATEGRLTDKTVYTELHHFLGTPAYMSPEQAALTSVDIDTRSDIYSLGVLLYELLTGGTPFDQQELLKAGLDAMRQTIRTKEPPRPSTRLSTLGAADLAGVAQARRSELPKLIHLLRGDLDWIVMKCLEKDRARRYETANGLARDIERHLDNEPVVARPASSVYRLQKLVRRNKLAFAASGAVAATLVLGLGVSTWLFIRESKAHERALAAERTQSRLREAAQTAQANEAQEHRRAEARAYVADMHLAQEAWEQNNVRGLRELLDETAAYPARGFEWYYWQRQMHLERMTLRGHVGEVDSVAFSPDGQRIATCSWDRTVKVWDAASGKELLTLKGHKSNINSVAFSPDGRRIVTGSNDPTAKVWDAASGTNLLTLKGHTNDVGPVAFSPDGQRIVTGSMDRTARVWDAGSGRELLILNGHSNTVNSASFSADGKWIVTASDDDTAKVWDAASGHELRTLRTGSPVNWAAFSPDGRRIVAGLEDGTAKVWDAASDNPLLTLRAHSTDIFSVAFSPDGQRIVTGSGDKTAKVWDAASGQELRTLRGHTARVTSVAFSPDGQRIVTASFDQTAKVWDAAIGKEPLTLKGHTNWIKTVRFSPDGKRIATSSSDGSAKVWEVASGKVLLTLERHRGTINGLAFSPDGRRIVVGSRDGTVEGCQAADGKELFTFEAHGTNVSSAAFSPDGRRFVTASNDRTAKVWDAASGTNLLTLKGHRDMILSVDWSPDGRRIATASYDGTAKVWDAASGVDLLTLTGHSTVVYVAVFSPDGRRIATGGMDATAKVWDAASGKELLTFKGHSAEVSGVAFSPDGQRIVTSSADGTAKLWDAADGKELLTLKGHSVWVNSVAFSPDGRRIVTGGGDYTAKVWEAATAQQVDAWQREEQAAIERLAAPAEHERALRAQIPGAIKQWLVLAPVPFEGGGVAGSGAVALGHEQVAQEAHLRPRAGDRVSLGASELVWKAVRQDDFLLDFNQIVGQPTDWSVAYAVSYIQSETAQTGLLMKVGSDDQAKIYLNGKEIYRNEEAGPRAPDQGVVSGVELRAGLNVLVFKVVNETFGWWGSVWFTDAAGQPVKGIRVTLTPP